MAYTPVQVVDKDDKPVKGAMLDEVWQKGLVHRIVRVMLHSSSQANKILLQKRSANQTVYPDCWDNSAGGYVDVNEDYEQAVHREMQEELGVSDVKLQEVGKYYQETYYGQRKMNRFVKVYKGAIDSTPERLQDNELSEVKWFTVDEIKQLIKDHPDKVADGLSDVIKRYY